VVRALLIRGMLVGLLAGLLAFLVAKVLGESAVGHAIGFEAVRSAAEGQPQDPELVSRTVQSTVGLLSGTTLFGIAVGGIYSLGYAVAQGRLGRLGVRPTAAVVALLGFCALYLLPFLKYPANPPSIGNPDTIGRRTALYLLMILISVVVVVGGVALARQLQPRFGGWDATLLAGAAVVAIMAISYAVLPRIDETPDGFPADVLWRFRLASLAIQVTIWTTIGVIFGSRTERASRSAARSRPSGMATAGR